MIKNLRNLFIALNLIPLSAMKFCEYAATLPPQEYPDLSYVGMSFPVWLALSLAFVVFWLIFNRKVMLASIVGMLFSVSSIRTYWPVNIDREIPEGCIKVLSYNTHYFGMQDLDSSNEVLNYILDTDADIACLVEANIAEENARNWFGDKYPYILDDTTNLNDFVLLSKFPVLDCERIDYEAATNSSYAYRLNIGGDTVIVIANHLESYKLTDVEKDEYKTMVRHPKDEQNILRFDSLTTKIKTANVIRASQVDSVAAYVERNAGRSIICCGDFNDPTISYTHHRLTRVLNDAYTRSGNGPGISYNASGMYFRIDYILTSPNITAYGAKVDKYSRISDHYPIFSYLKIGGK